MKYRDEDGYFQELYFKASDTLPIGTIVSYGSATPPTNWLVCDGSAVSRTTYAALFAAIGTSYGSGDGSTTFNLPDLRGRVPVGKSTDTEFDTLGETGGEKTHTLTTTEMPSHTHEAGLSGLNQVAQTTVQSGNYPVNIIGDYAANWNATGLTINNAGGGQAHNILQPYIVTNYIIKAAQSIGVVANVENTSSESTKNVYSCDYINDALVEVYSTDEVVTNKVWVDGKPIYRKIFMGTINDSTKLLENVDYLINAYGTVYMNGNTRTLNYYELYNNLQYFVNLRGNSNNIYFACVVAGQPSNPTNCNIVLEYTKTTD